MWLILLTIHLVGLVGFNLLLRKSVLAKADRFTLATVLQTGIAIPAMALLIIHPPEFHKFDGRDFALIGCTVLLTIALQTVNVKALQYLEASVFSVLYNLRIILTTILGIAFLNEKFVWQRVIGGLFILLAIFIVRQRGSHVVRLKGVEWGVLAAIVLSFLNLSEKLLINSIGFINYFPLESVLAAAVMWAYLIRSRPNIDRNLLKQPRMLQLMSLRAASAYGFSGALAAGALVSVANYISGLSVILMVLLGVILLNERDHLARKIIATIVAVIGLTLVLLSGILTT